MEATRKFYAVKQNQGTVSVRDLARRISRETMLGLVETNAVIEALLAAVPALLAEGKLVSLGEFGSFRLTIKSDGTETPEAFNASYIVNLRPSTYCSKSLIHLTCAPKKAWIKQQDIMSS
ncbi:MAG: HU family DNA-binding protein [Bacteroidales bacterium]|nr:HU family DNA-binding protein [Bacteroidales bacterium]